MFTHHEYVLLKNAIETRTKSYEDENIMLSKRIKKSTNQTDIDFFCSWIDDNNYCITELFELSKKIQIQIDSFVSSYPY